MDDIIVLAFGRSPDLRHSTNLDAAVHEIYRWHRDGWRIVVVAPATHDTAERQLKEARSLTEGFESNAPPESPAPKQSSCTTLLAAALDRVGVAARLFHPRQIGLTVTDHVLGGEPMKVNCARLKEGLAEGAVLVIPGFFGYTQDERLHLLGGGNSDLTAAHLAHALRANRCRFITEHDGVYDLNPALATPRPARRFVALSYADTPEHATRHIQPETVRFLERHRASTELTSVVAAHESTLGPLPRELIEAKPASPLSVLVFGSGETGSEICQRITAMPEHFRLADASLHERLERCLALTLSRSVSRAAPSWSQPLHEHEGVKRFRHADLDLGRKVRP